MRPLVLYGAGLNMLAGYKKFAVEGRLPKCICDSDPAKACQTKSFGDTTLEILPIQEVLSRYPDAEFYITPNPPGKFEIIAGLLESGIGKERIINYEPFAATKRMSCVFLESMLVLGNNTFGFCCNAHGAKRIPSVALSDSSGEELFAAGEQVRENAIKDLENGTADGYCIGCSRAVATCYSNKRTIGTITFGTGFICQFKCSYCGYAKQSAEEVLRYIKRALAFINYLKTHGFMDEQTSISIANGEITINPMQNEIMEFFQNNPCVIMTNSAVYSKAIQRVLDMGKSKIFVSLDCGTENTFKLIKGVSCFTDVCDNIRRYSGHGPVDLKYILIPGKNDDVADIEGFMNLAESIGATVTISRNSVDKESFEKNIDKALSSISYFAKCARDRGLMLIPIEHFFDGQYRDSIIEALG